MRWLLFYACFLPVHACTGSKAPHTAIAFKNALNGCAVTNVAPFASRLIEWFDVHGRHDLPWQVKNDPYKVWVSEIMLQQTQVKTVLNYFDRFMQRFPTVQSLADATWEEVAPYWAGLGTMPVRVICTRRQNRWWL